MITQYLKGDFSKDFLASIVVFLVALPLCMGIAIASGAPPIVGLMSGIIGGIVVGIFSGCPLQVSGPAAGIAVMVYEFIDKFGVASLVPLGIIVGAFQLLVYSFKLADYFKAISPALIKGLLSAIGLLILVSQVHVAFDAAPKKSGLQNLIHIPNSFYDFVVLEGGGRIAFGIAVLTLLSIILWQVLAKKLAKIIPAPLFAILVVSTGAHIFGLDIKFIDIPKDILTELNTFNIASFDYFSISMLFSALAIAFVATTETLLSVTAVDKLSDLENSDYNKEIMAQGFGNIIAGFFGALPITGVIVRSSANVESGARTRGSAVIHGIWLLSLTFFFTSILAFIPVSALAGILIFVGWKLLNPMGMIKLYKEDRREALIFAITFILIVTLDLLTGVIVGFISSLVMLAFQLCKLQVEQTEHEDHFEIKLTGKASFLQVPQINQALPTDKNKDITVDTSLLLFVDLAIKEEVAAWKLSQEKRGLKINIIN